MRRLWESAGVRFVREILEVYFDRRVSRSAAELAYFLILSFFPVLICVNAFVGLLHLDVNLILAGTEEFLPKESRSILGDYILYITDNQSNAMLFAGLTMTLFSASAAFRALMNIMADIYGRTTYRGLGQVVASVAFSVLFLITIYLSLAVLLTGSWFLHLVETYLPWVRQVVGDWQWIRFWVLFCLVMLFVLLTYRMAAGHHHRPGCGDHPGVLRPGAERRHAGLLREHGHQYGGGLRLYLGLLPGCIQVPVQLLSGSGQSGGGRHPQRAGQQQPQNLLRLQDSAHRRLPDRHHPLSGQRPVRPVQRLPDRPGAGAVLPGHGKAQSGVRAGLRHGGGAVLLRRPPGQDHHHQRHPLPGGGRL